MNPPNVLQWSDRLGVGVPDLDGQHMLLVELVGEVHAAMSAGRGRAALEGLLLGLVEAARDHFLTEEMHLARAGYPDLAAHKTQHDGLLRRLEELHDRFLSGRLHLTVALATMLGNWFENHILTHDMKYVSHLAGNAHP